MTPDARISRKLVRPRYMTDGLKSIIIKSIRVGSIFRIHPFYWSDAEQRLKIRKGLLDRILYKCALAHITVELTFMAIRTVEAISLQTVSLETQIICAFCTIFHLFAIVLSYGILLAKDDIPDLLNGGFALLATFDDRLPIANPHSKIGIPAVWLIEQVQKIFFYSVNMATVTIVAVCLLRPDYPVLVSSLFLPNSDYYQVGIGVSIAVQLCFQIVYIPTCDFLLNVGTGVAIPLIPAIKALGSKRMSTAKEIRENLLDYNKVRIFLDQFERVYLHYLAPIAQYIMIALSTFGILGVIRLGGPEGSLLVIVGLISYGVLTLSFGGLSCVSSGGKEILSRWRQNYAIDQRNIRCLKPIRMNLSFYAFIDKGILLTSTDIIINSSITMLLI